MKKTITVLTLCAVFIALYVPASGQQPEKIPRIGYLTGSASLSDNPTWHEAFRQGLRELGYVEGKNIIIEWRSHERGMDIDRMKIDRQRALAGELAHLKVDVIVTVGSGDTRAAKEATTTIPIVMIQAGDPVGSGFVASLARPGGTSPDCQTFGRS
jgi:ABC-type uncharacterized transport system substrate-binding protein